MVTQTKRMPELVHGHAHHIENVQLFALTWALRSEQRGKWACYPVMPGALNWLGTLLT